MKNLFLLIFFATSTYYVFAQKLEKNEVDEFTGKTVKTTSWETLNKTFKFYSYVRFSKVDNSVFLNFKMMTGNKVYSVDEGEVLYFKFNDDEILKLSNYKYQITSHGGGAIGLSGSNALGVELTCIIDQATLSKLKEKTITKVRVYTSKGYVESDVKEKQAEKFKKIAELID